jgi:hypothetical protein
MEDITVDDLVVELNALRIRVAQLEAAQGAAADPDNANHVDNAVAFRRGDRIRITNRVKRPANWNSGVVWEEDKERTATVTRVTPNQIHFLTDNGTRTWRAPGNVRRIGT